MPTRSVARSERPRRAAEWAKSSLPESLEIDHIVNVFAKRGITRGRLVDLLGVSP